MHKYVVILFFFVGIKLFAQTDSEKIQIYRLLLDKYLDPQSGYVLTPMCLVDSTVIADFSVKPSDTVFRDFFEIELFDSLRRNDLSQSFVSATYDLEKLPQLVLDTNQFVQVEMNIFKGYFIPCMDEEYNLNSCWEEFCNAYNVKGYCGFSTPYFYNSSTALIYFYYLYEPMAGSGDVFFLKKDKEQWKIVYKISQWVM